MTDETEGYVEFNIENLIKALGVTEEDMNAAPESKAAVEECGLTASERVRLLAEKVLGWQDVDGIWHRPKGDFPFTVRIELDPNDPADDGLMPWNPLDYYPDAWMLVEHIEPLVTRFKTADGYVILQSGHWGDHGDCVVRDYTDEETDLELDPRPWSFHIHLGLIGSDDRDKLPAWWGTDDGTWNYCAVGSTPQDAICAAVLKAYRLC
jgi:hypothetical protein